MGQPRVPGRTRRVRAGYFYARGRLASPSLVRTTHHSLAPFEVMGKVHGSLASKTGPGAISLGSARPRRTSRPHQGGKKRPRATPPRARRPTRPSPRAAVSALSARYIRYTCPAPAAPLAARRRAGPRRACRRWTAPSAPSSPTTTTSSGPSSATSPPRSSTPWCERSDSSRPPSVWRGGRAARWSRACRACARCSLRRNSRN